MTKHLPRLDSLRGIAALMVGGFHAQIIGGDTKAGQLAAWFLGFIYDGRTAVSIFFVLSGLVLGLSLRRAGPVNPSTYLHFCGRRFFRLYPAYMTSAFLYLTYYLLLWTLTLHGASTGHGLCDIYTQEPPLSRLQLVGNFCFLNQALNIPSWTLKVEAQAAFILPLLHFFSIRFRGRGEILALAALVVFSFLPGSGKTGSNLYLFYLGYLIPPLTDFLCTTRLLPKHTRVGWLLAVAIFFLAISHLVSRTGMSFHFGTLMAALGSTLLLLVLLSNPSYPLLSFLDNRIVKFVGMISYSYYLYNWISVDLTQRMFYFARGEVPTGTLIDWLAVFLTSSLLCLLLASCSFYLVEKPGIKLGGILLPSKVEKN